jgi:hypothetical protein
MSIAGSRTLALGVLPFVVALVLGGCEPSIIVPIHDLPVASLPLHDLPVGQVKDMAAARVSADTSLYHIVQLRDDQGKVIKTLAELGAGPWRTPDGRTLFFVSYDSKEMTLPDATKVKTITGALYRAASDGENPDAIALPEEMVPCEVKVSPSGRYLAVAGIPPKLSDLPIPIDEYALNVSPRSLNVIDVKDSSTVDIGVSWPGACGFAWAPARDQLAIAPTVDPSAILMVLEHLAARRCLDALRRGVTGFAQGAPAGSAATASAAASRAAQGPLSGLEEGFTRNLLLFAGIDLLLKAPRASVAALWSPGQEEPQVALRLYRPYYCGFEWMPDGRNVLLFSIEGGPVATRDDSFEVVFPRFRCHSWDTLEGKVKPIPVPRSDAFAAFPSPGKQPQLLWICGSKEHELILTDDEGRNPRSVARKVKTAFRPQWLNDHVFAYTRPAQTGAKAGPGALSRCDLVTFDTRTMKSAHREIIAPFASGLYAIPVESSRPVIKIRPRPAETRHEALPPV